MVISQKKNFAVSEVLDGRFIVNVIEEILELLPQS